MLNKEHMYDSYRHFLFLISVIYVHSSKQWLYIMRLLFL